MTTGIYRGFSTYQYQKRHSFNLSDIELVKMDLLNYIYTKKGERVMMPNFGTRIPMLAFEPLDQITLDILEEDLRAAVNFDPRVKLIDLQVIPVYDNNYVLANLSVLYIELNIIGNIDINIQFEV
jgi:phage baseplate assembly protein W